MNSELNLRNDEVENNEDGASLVEYALLVALIAVVCIVALQFMGQKTSQTFSNIATQLTT